MNHKELKDFEKELFFGKVKNTLIALSFIAALLTFAGALIRTTKVIHNRVYDYYGAEHE